MEKLFLIKNPELFQGEKYLKNNKNYFEGWYFKIVSDKGRMAFIPGISISRNEKRAFIQVITDNDSYFVDYDIDDFKFGDDPFWVKIGNNYFSKESIHIDINDEGQKLRVYGDVRYFNSKNIDISIFSPNIMGMFSYIPFMECNHGILSMKNKVDGVIKINNKEIDFDDGIGYIEKDWGCSFPDNYIWCQGNNFRDDKVSFMLSIADIPFKVFSFRGLICSLIIENQEYRFATYNGAKIVQYDVDNNLVNIVLRKGNYYLEVKAKYKDGLKLSAPVKGKMDRNIIESIGSEITVSLKERGRVIYEGTSINCGLEIVRE